MFPVKKRYLELGTIIFKAAVDDASVDFGFEFELKFCRLGSLWLFHQLGFEDENGEGSGPMVRHFGCRTVLLLRGCRGTRSQQVAGPAYHRRQLGVG